MKAKIFTIAFDARSGKFDAVGFEAFCEAHHVRNMQSAFFQMGEMPWWSVWVEYGENEKLQAEKKFTKKEEDRPSFNASEKALLKALKQYRLEASQKEGIPAYLIATNKQLEAMIVEKAVTLSALGAIKGLGEKKVARHGKAFINILKDYLGNDTKN